MKGPPLLLRVLALAACPAASFDVSRPPSSSHHRILFFVRAHRHGNRHGYQPCPVAVPMVPIPRYGPPMDDNTATSADNVPDTAATKEVFGGLLQRIVAIQDVTHLPGLLSQHVDVVLQISTPHGAQLVEELLQDIEQQEGSEAADQVAAVVDIVVSFAESFVEEAKSLDDQHKETLGHIIKLLADKERSGRDLESALDELLVEQRPHLTAGFLKHVEGQCQRIASAPQLNTESAQLLHILRLIQMRVVDELGKDSLPEAGQVLGHLMGYESPDERLAVLEAALMVQGPSFGQEMKVLCEEALDGFMRVSNVDPNLVAAVQQVDQHLASYLEQR